MMCMSSTTLLRKGQVGQPTPNGGHFATKTNTDADVALTGHEGLSDSDIFEQSIKISGQFARRYKFTSEEAEDLAQDTMASVLLTRKRNPDRDVSVRLISTAARALASRQIDGATRHEDSSALVKLKQRQAQEEQQLGRHLTKREVDALATDIRQNWHDPRHRPTVGFQYEVRVESTETVFGGKDFTDTHPSLDPIQQAGNDATHELVDMVEDESLTKAQARLHAWNTLFGEQVPNAKPAQYTQSMARRYVAAVPDAVDVATRYIEGTATPEETAALFAPFGELGTPGRFSVADTIASRAKHGHRLWRSALDFGNQKNGDGDLFAAFEINNNPNGRKA